MKIEWNKVTWYSKLLAVILFVAVFCVGFNLGKKSDEINSIITPAQPLTTTKLINTVSYSCDGSKTILAKYYESDAKPFSSPDQPPIPTGSVALALSDGRSMTLPQTISADGGRYANSDESFIFWSKGTGAFVMEGKSSDVTYKNCVTIK
jgi:membrane-bound inhibitor of C-type lysozyme